jgi:Carbohydrate esterase, sialic acid-specific acetylesterase
MIKSFLMLGQSNMAGRGFLHEVEPIYNEKIKMLRNGQWQMMTEPINYDRPVAGVSLAASFAEAWSKAHPDEEIGLIPCAEGGSSLDDWHPEGTLFQHACPKLALLLKRVKFVAYIGIKVKVTAIVLYMKRIMRSYLSLLKLCVKN